MEAECSCETLAPINPILLTGITLYQEAVITTLRNTAPHPLFNLFSSVTAEDHQSFHLETTQQLRQGTRRYSMYHRRSVHFRCTNYVLNELMII
jgi:hypothetical protein